MTPEDIHQQMPGGWVGALAALAAAVGSVAGGVMWMRRAWSRDQASAAHDGGAVDIISRYKEQLEILQESEVALKARNDALIERLQTEARERTLAEAEAERLRIKLQVLEERAGKMAARIRERAPDDPVIAVITSGFMGLGDDNGGRR